VAGNHTRGSERAAETADRLVSTGAKLETDELALERRLERRLRLS
jgi:hypothetical protein